LPATEKMRIGCSGWSYKDWAGPFYPSNAEAKDYLRLYSRTFNCVEIDSSFYRIPSPSMISRWKNATPDGFTFSPKLSKKITHDNKLENYDSTLLYFYSVFSKLGNKLGPIVVQLPPSIKVEKHKAVMEKFVSSLEPRFKHAIEFRHKSWFTPETYKLLERNNIAMAWSINQYLETPSEVTADFAYLRMVGTREITKFDGIQKEMREEMDRWATALKEKAAPLKDDSYVFFNNHFAGFGPESVNEFRRLLGMIELNWTQDQGSGSNQATLL
jgi:uncharacterized protein YecE (DUF72 family)